MKEPAVRFLNGANFDDTPLAPIGFGKLAQLVDPIYYALQNLAVPPAGFAIAAHTVLGVPFAAIGLPGHFRRFADLGDFQIAVPLLQLLGRVVLGALGPGSGGENWREGQASVRARGCESV